MSKIEDKKYQDIMAKSIPVTKYDECTWNCCECGGRWYNYDPIVLDCDGECPICGEVMIWDNGT